MSNIKELNVGINLTTDKFSAAMKQVNQGLKQLSYEYKSASKDSDYFENSFTGLTQKMKLLDYQIAGNKQKLELLSNELISTSSNTERLKNEYEEAKTTWEASKQKLEQLRTTLGENSAEFKEQEAIVNKNKTALDRSEKAYSNNITTVRNLENQIKKAKGTIQYLSTELESSRTKFNTLGKEVLTTDQKLEKLNNSVPLLESKMKLLSSQLSINASKTKQLSVEKTNLNTKLDLARQKMELYQEKVKENGNVLDSYKNKLTRVENAIQLTTNELEEAKNKYTENSTRVRDLESRLLKLKDMYLKLEVAIEGTNNDQNKFQTELNESSADVNNLSKDMVKLSGKLASAPFQEAADKMNRLGQGFQTAGMYIQNAGRMLSMYVTAPIISLGVNSVKTATEFEYAMSGVQAISNETGENMELLTAKARQLGKDTSFSAKEVADALQYQALAGWKTHDMLIATEPILRLAEAGNMDLARASDLVTDSMGALRIELGESGEGLYRYLDVVAKTASNSNTSVEQLMAAFLNVGPAVSRLGIPVTEAAAALGILANNGLKGEEAGTKLNSILTRLTAQSKPAIAAWDSIGVSVYDSQGKFRGLTTVLQETKGKFEKLSDEQKAYFLKNVSGQFSMTEFQNLLNATGGELENLTANVDDSGGALMTMAKIMKDNLQGKLENLQSSFEEMMIVIGNKMIPIVEKVVLKVTEMMDRFSTLNPKLQDNILKWVAIAAAVGPLLIIFGKLTTGVGGLLKTFGFITGGIGKLAGLFGTLSASAGTAGAAVAGASTGAAGSVTALGGTFAKIAPLLTNPWVLLGAAAVAAVGTVIYQNNKMKKETKEMQEKVRKEIAGVEESYEKMTTSISENIDKINNNEIEWLGTQGKANFRQDMIDIQKIIETDGADATKDMNELIQHIKDEVDTMPEDVKKTTGKAILEMADAFVRDKKLPLGEAEKLIEELNEILGQELKLNTESLADNLKLQDIFNKASEGIREAKGWFGWGMMSGDYDQLVAVLRDTILAAEDLTNVDVTSYVKRMISSMEEAGAGIDVMSYAFSKNLGPAMYDTFGPEGGLQFIRTYVEELGLGGEGVEAALDSLGVHFKHANDTQKETLIAMSIGLMEDLGVMEELMGGYSQNMFNENSELWAGIFGKQLEGSENSKLALDEFTAGTVAQIANMSSEAQVGAVQWMSEFINELYTTGQITKTEAEIMAENINNSLNKDVTTTIKVETKPYEAGMGVAKKGIDDLTAKTAKPGIDLITDRFDRANTAVQTALQATNDKKTNPLVTAQTETALSNVKTFRQELELIKDKTVTVTYKEKTVKETILKTTPSTNTSGIIKQDLYPETFTLPFSANVEDNPFSRLKGIENNYQVTGGYYNRTTSPSLNKSSNISTEKEIVNLLKEMIKNTGKQFTQNLVINSAKELSPREIAKQTRLTGQQLLKLY